MVRIAVVGAGIIGLSSAICIQRSCPEPDVEITLITEKLSPFTTGDGAAGIWSPYLLSETPEQDVYRWAKATHDFLNENWKQGDGGRKGVSMIPVVRVTSEVEETDPFWKSIVYGFRRMHRKDLAIFNKPSLKTGFSFVTFTCEATKLLPHFLQLFLDSGGKLQIKRVDDVMELQAKYDIVVNCSGLGAHHIVPDPLVQPKRGQVIRVTAPSMKWALLDDDDIGNYIIPNQDTVVLGGTHQEGDWNTKAYPEDTNFIKTGCARIVPSLKIVHNYGHGGSGLTLFWGCALQTAGLVRDAVQLHQQEENRTNREPLYYTPKSKL